MTATQIEHRLAALERKVEGLVAQRSTNKDWVLKMWGSFANDPDFDKAMAYGRQWRAAENRKSLRATAKKRRK